VVFQDNHQSAAYSIGEELVSIKWMHNSSHQHSIFLCDYPTNDMIGEFFTKPLQAGVEVL
jgi:hypothetical protein